MYRVQYTVWAARVVYICSILIVLVFYKMLFYLLQEILQTLARYMLSYHKEVNQVSYIDITYYLYYKV